MFFTSYNFILFVILLFILYYALPRKFQWGILLGASYIFYAIAGWWYFFFILTTTISAYIISLKIGDLHSEQKEFLAANKEGLSRDEIKEYKGKNQAARWKWIVTVMVLNFGILLVLKYLTVTVNGINDLLAFYQTGYKLSFWTIALPMGISFYTFQTMGYVIDIYRGKYPPERNIFKVALFVSFFPQLVQGPISRFDQLSETLFARHNPQWKNISFGLQRMAWGFFKKMVIADRIALGLSTLTQSPETYQGAYVFAAMVFYAIQLYGDFTGGIDVTLGIAQVLGIKLPENFLRPYFSKSIGEYWRRWHITLISWFRDYVFYPLSVSRPVVAIARFIRKKGGSASARRATLYISTMSIWILTGIWHGSNWKFIVWGMLNGFFLLLSVELAPLYSRFHERFPVKETSGFKLFQITRTLLLVSAINLFDVYTDAGTTWQMLGTLFTTFNYHVFFDGGMLSIGLDGADYIIIFAGVVVMALVDLLQRKGSVREMLASQPVVVRYALYYLLIVSIFIFGIYGIGYDAGQFIYNQF